MHLVKSITTNLNFVTHKVGWNHHNHHNYSIVFYHLSFPCVFLFIAQFCRKPFFDLGLLAQPAAKMWLQIIIALDFSCVVDDTKMQHDIVFFF